MAYVMSTRTHILDIILTGPTTDYSFIVADSYLRNLYQIDALTGNVSQLLPVSTATNPFALAYDSTNKLLYWTDVNAHTINIYSLHTNISIVIYQDPFRKGKI